MRFLTICSLLLTVGIMGTTAIMGQAKTAAKKNDIVFETTKGKIVVRLFADKAPLSAKNMLTYVDEGYYNGTIFHRVIDGFMIQGGGFTADLRPKEAKHPPIKNEAANGLANKRGTVAMARTNVVDSATSQFFINVVDNHFLDHVAKNPREYGYAVIGEVIEGMNVVDAIRQVKTLCSSRGGGDCDQAKLPPGMQDVPAEPVSIIKAYRAP